MRRAKIVATLGPALDDPTLLRAALDAGIDVVRLNFSHGTAEEHARRLGVVRDLARRAGRQVGSLGDLQGPKIRLGELPEAGVLLTDGAEVVLVAGEDGLSHYGDRDGTALVPVSYRSLAEDVEPGGLVLLDDGLIRLVVSAVNGREVLCRVVAGGVARSRKGVNLPGARVSAASLTGKDHDDLAAMLDMEVDWIALSFVRSAADIVELRRLVASGGGEAPIVAKLERPEVLGALDEVIAASDAVMVARGDLGVEIGPERVPAIQKDIISHANRAGRPVVTATEMLESMVRSPRPSRAEASDVANAVFDGTDALMLSGETAVGRFPVEAVRTMARIIEVAESSPHLLALRAAPTEVMPIPRVVARAAVQAAKDVGARALVVFSLSGASIQLVSKFRPTMPLIGLTPRERTLRRLPLLWGTGGELVAEKDHTRDLIEAADAVCRSRGLGEPGDPVVIVSGIPGGHGGTNRILVHELGRALPD